LFFSFLLHYALKWKIVFSEIKNCFGYLKNGHSENVHFRKSATTFFSDFSDNYIN
jgi:hypothetical protein